VGSLIRDQLRALPTRLPCPGSGRTRDRFDGLWQIASRSPSLGRLAEAHYDAIAILEEFGRAPLPGAVYGVWAAGSKAPVVLERANGCTWHLGGTKPWCSGVSIVSHALVVARTDLGESLVLIDATEKGVTFEPPSWQSPALAETDTRAVTFDVYVSEADLVGGTNAYGERAGFWHGATGVAASWAGCISGVVHKAAPYWRADAHSLAHRGAVDSLLAMIQSVLRGAADDIDESPHDVELAHRIALRVRYVVDVSITEISHRLTTALGPGPFAHQPDLHRHLFETDLYRRQSHGERDLEALGRLVQDDYLPETSPLG
jgi:hypothetical protein